MVDVWLEEDSESEQSIGARDLTEWRSAPGRAIARSVTQAADRVATSARANVVLLVTAAVGVLLACILVGLTAAVYDAVVESNGIAALDRPALDAAKSLRTPGLNSAVARFSTLGGVIGLSIIAVSIVVAMTLAWRRRTPLVLMTIATLGSVAMTVAGKAEVGRTRPPVAESVPPYLYSPSFPSGHTLNTTVVMGVTAYLLVRRQTRLWVRVATVTGLASWTVAMGLSRVYLGHHWLTDVIAGWLLGLAWVILLVTAHRLYLTVRRADRVREEPRWPRSGLPPRPRP